jgi:hypothetical protein
VLFSRISNMPTQDSQANAATRDQSLVGHRKRKRRTLACSLCRRRKLKCDQILPICGRCLKSGNASCSYESDDGLDNCLATENGLQRNGMRFRPRSDMNRDSSVIEQTKEKSLAGLVTYNASPRGANTYDREVTASGRRNESTTITGPHTTLQYPETMLFRGREFATEFYGTTSPISALIHVIETSFCHAHRPLPC